MNKRHKTSGRGLWWAGYACLTIIVLALPFVLSSTQLGLASIIGIFSIAAIGLDLTFGYAGQLSLGHGAFFGLGGYATGLLTANYGVSPITALGVGVFCTVIVSLVIGALCSRLETFDVALATMGLAIIMESLLLGFRGFTGGGAGVTGIPSFHVLGWNFSSYLSMYYLIWGLLLVFLLLAGNLVSSHIGRSYKATHHDELVAEMTSINTFWIKVQSFVYGAILCSVAGSLYAHYMVYISPHMGGFIVSADLLTMVILGGSGTLYGAIIGTVVLKILPELLVTFQEYQLVFKGLILLLLLLFFPRGVMGFGNLLGNWIWNQFPGESSSSVNTSDTKTPES